MASTTRRSSCEARPPTTYTCPPPSHVAIVSSLAQLPSGEEGGVTNPTSCSSSSSTSPLLSSQPSLTSTSAVSVEAEEEAEEVELCRNRLAEFTLQDARWHVVDGGGG